jgi:hypothetical protein
MNRTITQLDELDAVLRPDAVATFAEYQAGYRSYFNRRGPGSGFVRSAGWLQAARDERREMRQRADERLDANEYKWMF